MNQNVEEAMQVDVGMYQAPLVAYILYLLYALF